MSDKALSSAERQKLRRDEASLPDWTLNRLHAREAASAVTNQPVLKESDRVLEELFKTGKLSMRVPPEPPEYRHYYRQARRMIDALFEEVLDHAGGLEAALSTARFVREEWRRELGFFYSPFPDLHFRIAAEWHNYTVADLKNHLSNRTRKPKIRP
jgi:hypothetical protein